MTTSSVLPYGEWKSPISSALATEGSLVIQELHVDISADGTYGVFWTEMRYDEGGRYVICSKLEENALIEWTPKEFNARTTVHEYGGGATFVNNGTVYFSNFKDQRIYKQSSPLSTPEPITPPDCELRYADGEIAVHNGMIYCVREDHSQVKAGLTKEPENTIVMINPETQEQKVIATGCDFYSSPRCSPNCKKIAWVQWNHPNMPWDSTELICADLEENGEAVKTGSEWKVVSSTDVSVMHPRWTAENELLYIGDQTDWWNLYSVANDDTGKNILPKDKEIGDPHWIFGQYAYDITRDGSDIIATSYAKKLGLLQMKTGDYKELDTGYQSHQFVQLSFDRSRIFCVASSPTRFSTVIQVSVTDGKVTVVRESKTLSVDEGYISVPQTVSWPTGNGEISHGYFFPPQNKDYKTSDGNLPGLLVQCHGGPTSATTNELQLKTQYFTSRGMALLKVDYRGSTGYGKAYRHRLRKNWGICDVEDACSGAQYLANAGHVDASKLCIDGGSAGGYTTLACLAFKDVFKAGASHYGIGDLEALAKDTHKFESRYLDSLIAPYTDENKHIYIERSPVHHIKQFSCPIAFFQGDEDKIVPPNQAEMMFNAVKQNGIPCAYVLFQGEQHGFRKAANVQKALDGEFYFYSKVFGFNSADKDVEMKIYNL